MQFKRQAQTLQNLALRKILGVFRTTPTILMEIESGIPPVEIRLDANVRKYAFRTNLIGEDHPIRTELEKINLGRREGGVTTQLERIKQLREKQPANLEVVNPFLFPPWADRLPYTTRISTQDKATTGATHAQDQKDSLDNRIAIYSDASVLFKGGNVGVGVAAYDYSWSRAKPSTIVSKNLGVKSSVYNGEVEGLI